MKPRRIAFLKSDLAKRGGLQKYALRLARACVQKGHEVTFLTTDYSKESLGELPFDIVNLGKRSKVSFWHLLSFDAKCKKFLAENKMDVVFGLDRNFCLQTHYRAGNGVHGAYLDRRKKRESWVKAASFSLNPLHNIILAMEKKTFERDALEVLFTNSFLVKDEILAYYNVAPEKINVVHNGVEWHELQKPFVEGLQMRTLVQKQLGLDPDCYQFLFVGNDYDRKGLTLFLQALSLLSNRSFQLSVVGKERTPERYEAMAYKLGLQEKVRFFGAIPGVKTFYSAADCLVIPSLYDPFANVTVEGLAMGLYVLSSKANGGSEVITSDLLGSTFSDLEDPNELASLLQQAMNRPKTPLQAEAIRNAVAHLDFSNQLEKIVSVV